MSKFGKIFLSIFIFGFIFIFPLASQGNESGERHEIMQAVIQQAARQALQQVLEWSRAGLQEMYMEYLSREGFVPEVDKDNDIKFKVSGNNYYVIIDESEPKFFHIYTGFLLDNMTMEAAYDLVNYTNRRSKVAKLSLSPHSSGKLVVSISAELLLDKPEDFQLIFTRTLSLIDNAKYIFQTQVKQRTQSI